MIVANKNILDEVAKDISRKIEVETVYDFYF